MVEPARGTVNPPGKQHRMTIKGRDRSRPSSPGVRTSALRSGTSAPHRVRDRWFSYFASARFGGDAGHDLISVS